MVELEDSRNSLVKENQQLKESISDLKLQLQNIDKSVSFANTSELGKVCHPVPSLLAFWKLNLWSYVN